MSNPDLEKSEAFKDPPVFKQPVVDVAEGTVVFTGQGEVLERSFNLLSACATGITTGNSWAVFGAGIVSSPL
jgi:hypothetical protein